MLGIVDKQRCYTTDSFWEDYSAVAEKLSHTVERNIVDKLQYISDSFWYRQQIINPNMKAELP